jgi:hypothetical protein
MGRYWVDSVINFGGYVEADSKDEAEQKGYYYDNLEYVSVDSVEVGDNELECDGCGVDMEEEECECETDDDEGEDG